MQTSPCLQYLLTSAYSDMMRVILTPNITLSGAMQSGTLISTELSMEDASFVTRVFAIPNTRNKTSIASCCNPIA